MHTHIHTADALRAALTPHPVGDALATDCACRWTDYAGWESLSEDRWPSRQMQRVGTLRDPQIEEPTFEEFHPAGTRYDSPVAPIAPLFFPYNRCDLWQCSACHRYLLRYTEFGGYYIDHRVRAVRPDLIVD